jgi:hypothetical protein
MVLVLQEPFRADTAKSVRVYAGGDGQALSFLWTLRLTTWPALAYR